MKHSSPDALVSVKDLNLSFRKRQLFRPTREVRAINNASFDIGHGETLGLVGESGSGKSTTGRALLGLLPVDSGEIFVDGHDVRAAHGRAMRDLRPHMQMVFQDPYSSLDPSATIGASISEPLRVHRGMSQRQAWSTVSELLDVVGLRPSHATRFPYEFSGGQRQRVAIARALALRPKLIVCDEAVSALDVSTQNQVINLLEDLREDFGLSYLFIAHDLAVVRHIADRVAVMYLGHIVESGPVESVYINPKHPYTQALLSAIPMPDPDRTKKAKRTVLKGDLPDPASPPPGCPFQTRCPDVMDICRRDKPVARRDEGSVDVACHLYSAEKPEKPMVGAPALSRM
ncbi:ABC transporter ATP-binding protein [Rhodococcus sp. NPDC127530]|uniref:ABC transporter ATP-binding protein n=1 Tax=unclassified Rhodococcus (in: high G+C Gram-positive bacteria) TaxID=192944 RepID=UPI00362F37A4